MTIQKEAQCVVVRINKFFRISIIKQINTSNIIFECSQIQRFKFPEADVFHCRRWSGNRETARHRAMIRNIPIGDRSTFNNIRITSNYQVQNMSLNMGG